MPKRSSKPKKDENEAAFAVVAQATGQPMDAATISAFMAEMGRRGGLKGGKARAEKLSPERLSAIAHRAARTRWAKHQKKAR